MKKAAVIFIISVLTINLFAQDKPVVAPEKNVLKLNTLALIIRTGAVFYERKITDLTAAQLGVAFGYLKIGDTEFQGLSLTPEVKLYIRKNAIDGFYVSPYLRYNNFNYDDHSGSTGVYKGFGGGVSFGRQWIFQKGFVIDLFFGGHYTDSNVEITSGTEPSDVTRIEGFGIRTGFSIGFAF